MNIKNVKGTKDFYPEDKEVMNWIADTMRKVALNYGFLEVESPAFENLSLLCDEEAEETKSQIFVLEKRSNEQLGLRFDLTVPLARMFVAKQRELPKPVKWFCISRMWRYEAPQKGRLREFYQNSIECYGSNKPESDAEIVSMAIDTMLELGLKKMDFEVVINNRDLLQGFLEGLGIGKIEEIIVIIDKIKKIPQSEFIAELEKAGLSQVQIRKIDEFMKIKDLDKIDESKLNDRAKKGLNNLKQVMSLLEDKEDFIKLSLSTARGLAYYTGTVFEFFDRQGKYRSLFGGGRYDNMVRQFGGQDCPVTGIAMGFETLRLFLDEKMLLPDTELGVDYYIAPLNKDLIKEAVKIASKLRQNYKVNIDLMGRSLGKQMDFANKISAKNVIVIGENEIKSGKVKIKNMMSGEEQEVSLEELQ